MRSGRRTYQPIEAYGVIGDCRSAALISREGSLDWLCIPRFDSPSVFGALLDDERGGRFRVCPADPFHATRRYVGHSAALETTFDMDTGRLRLTDVMPVASEADKRRELWPDHEVLRVLECLSGEVAVDVLFDPRPEYATVAPPSLRDTGRNGWLVCQEGPLALSLHSDVPLRVQPGVPGARGKVVLRAGERRTLTLAFAHQFPLIVPPAGDPAEARLQRSIRWWEEWAGRCRYEGPYRDAVVRSAVTLKLLSYAPSQHAGRACHGSTPVGGVGRFIGL